MATRTRFQRFLFAFSINSEAFWAKPVRLFPGEFQLVSVRVVGSEGTIAKLGKRTKKKRNSVKGQRATREKGVGDESRRTPSK